MTTSGVGDVLRHGVLHTGVFNAYNAGDGGRIYGKPKGAERADQIGRVTLPWLADRFSGRPLVAALQELYGPAEKVLKRSGFPYHVAAREKPRSSFAHSGLGVAATVPITNARFESFAAHRGCRAPLQLLANMGVQEVRVDVAGTSTVFLNTHLASSHDPGDPGRYSEVRTRQIQETAGSMVRRIRAAHDTDLIFFVGDLNHHPRELQAIDIPVPQEGIISRLLRGRSRPRTAGPVPMRPTDEYRALVDGLGMIDLIPIIARHKGIDPKEVYTFGYNIMMAEAGFNEYPCGALFDRVHLGAGRDDVEIHVILADCDVELFDTGLSDHKMAIVTLAYEVRRRSAAAIRENRPQVLFVYPGGELLHYSAKALAHYNFIP